MVTAGPSVIYHVDQSDRLRSFNDAWSDFARENGAAELGGERIEGSVLWDHLDEETTQLYRRMLHRLRDGAPDIRFSFRCDAPDRRRLLAMHMSSLGGGNIAFVVTPLAEQERPTVDLLDSTLPRTDAFVLICAWCKLVELPSGAWVEVEAAIPALGLFDRDAYPRLSHGICPECSDDLIGVLDGPNTDDGDTVTFGALVPVGDSTDFD